MSKSHSLARRLGELPCTHRTSNVAQGHSADGLSENEVAQRRQRWGYNELPEKKENPLLKFLGYFWGPIPGMIEVALVLSAIVRHWADFAIILLLLVANAVVGAWEEFQAGNAIAALKARLALKARVKRGGQWLQVAARELVPDDLVRLRLGDIVPADAALLSDDPIEVDQSALTGESLPVTRKKGESVYAGSIIRQGETDAVVTGTGVHTYFGKTASLVAAAHTVSHFQKAVLKIGNYLIVLAVVLVALILSVALWRGDPMLETFQFALVLTVAAIPVAMPTVLSVTMAVGARSLARRQAIVSRLVAIEELAGMDLLCSDKTGTLTKNQLALGEPFALEGVSPAEVIVSAALASRAEDDDPIDNAVLAAVPAESRLSEFQVTHYQPFDPVHKRTEATVRRTWRSTRFKSPRGRRRSSSRWLTNAEQVRPLVEQAVDNFAGRGFRSLGVARRDGEGPWRFLGVLPLFDPPREDSAATIATAREMGVDVKMVTGDQVAIGKEIARQVGLGTNILDAHLFADPDETRRGIGRNDRGCGRLCASVSRTQVPHRRIAAGSRPHRGHDRRWRERCPCAQKSRRRHRGLRGDGCGPRGGRHRAADAGFVGDHRCDQGESQDLSADEQLCHLSNRRDDPRAVVHDAVDSGF